MCIYVYIKLVWRRIWRAVEPLDAVIGIDLISRGADIGNGIVDRVLPAIGTRCCNASD